jgi:hypothetical protein
MLHFSETMLALSKITDPGLFENLAAAVLRRAEPGLYANLTQPGVNAEGKTVKAPIDAVCFVRASSPPHMVTVHHTICAQDDLRKKWLHDPSTVTPRRKTGTPSAPPGDVIKVVAIVSAERERTPDIYATLALTTNEEPPEDVTRDAANLARRHGIDLDIWSRSRIADYLDHHPEGQWLRKKYLGIEQERLSLELLRDLSRCSLQAYRPPPQQENTLIERDVVQRFSNELPRPVGFVVAESGYGKSVAAYLFLKTHIEHGGCGFVLPHELLATCVTLDQAIDAALRQLHPALETASGAAARALCSAASPLLIVVEDVNKSGQSAALIERLARWSSVNRNDKDGPEASWQVVCPVWPQLFAALGDEARQHAGGLGLQLGPYTREEARRALQRRAAFEGLDLLALEADEFAEALGCDPLLIALHSLGDVPSPGRVIGRFITQRTQHLAGQGGAYSAYEYEVTLVALGRAMLDRKRVDPSWSEVLEWFRNSESQLARLRELTKHGEIIRVSGSGKDGRIAFRHDRVKKCLLISAATDALQNKPLDEQVFADPFFADVIGAALADEAASALDVTRTRTSNPLALFHALQTFREPTTPVQNAVIESLHQWLAEEGSHSRAHHTLRHWALHVLAGTQSSHVVGFVRKFRDRSWNGRLASFRNGDLRGGIRLCYALEPGSGASWRDRSIEHAKARYGATLIRDLDELLRSKELLEIDRVGGLRLAGHFGESALTDAIWKCWELDNERSSRLDEYVWAIAQCAGERTALLLASVCDAWAALPDQAEKQGNRSPRSEVGGGWLHWAFWKNLPKTALTYFINRAGTDESLRSNIMYMLHGVDDPDAVEFVVRELARGLKEIEGTGKFWPFVNSVAEHWQRQQRERGRVMSSQSRERLRTLWQDESGERHLRIQSFRLWAATIQPEDLALLQTLVLTGVLGDDVLRARLKRDDRSAIRFFIERIRNDQKGYWWQYARDIWSEELTEELDEEFSRRSAAVERTWGTHHEGDWITSELVTRLDAFSAEMLLVKHWEHLRYSDHFVQAALYTATPRVIAFAEQALAECPDRPELLKHIARHFGIRMLGHPGVTRIEQLEALIPYLDDLDDMAIHDIWELCNERGWTTLRKEHLDARLSGKSRERSGLDDELIMGELDKELSYERNPFVDLWVENHLGNGLTVENILQATRKWLKLNKVVKALEVAASIVIHAGKRADAEILLEGSDGSQLASEIIADTRYAIQRRSLI